MTTAIVQGIINRYLQKWLKNVTTEHAALTTGDDAALLPTTAPPKRPRAATAPSSALGQLAGTSPSIDPACERGAEAMISASAQRFGGCCVAAEEVHVSRAIGRFQT